MKKLALATAACLALAAPAYADVSCHFHNVRNGAPSTYVFGANTDNGETGTFVEKVVHSTWAHRAEYPGTRPTWSFEYDKESGDFLTLRPLSEPDDGGWAIAISLIGDPAALTHFGSTVATGRCVGRNVARHTTADLGY